MSILSWARYALGIATTIALLAGCNGASTSAPDLGGVGSAQLGSQGVPSWTLTARDGALNAVHPDRRRSWISPDAKKRKLLYVSDWVANYVDIFDLPSGKPLGRLAGFGQPQGMCADGSHLWVADTLDEEVIEYKAASPTPIATLQDPGQFPVGCSYDKTTGNLAVGNIGSISSGEGNVLVYPKASGDPVTYTCSSLFRYYFLGYDDKGDLYVDGLVSSSGAFGFCGLRNGSSSMQTVSLNQSIDYPGQVQWDGEYVTVSDQNSDTIYRFTIKGKTGTNKGSTALEGADDCTQNWIEKNRVYCPATPSGKAFIYAYPSGGAPAKVIGGFQQPIGAVVVRYRK